MTGPSAIRLVTTDFTWLGRGVGERERRRHAGGAPSGGQHREQRGGDPADDGRGGGQPVVVEGEVRRHDAVAHQPVRECPAQHDPGPDRHRTQLEVRVRPELEGHAMSESAFAVLDVAGPDALAAVQHGNARGTKIWLAATALLAEANDPRADVIWGTAVTSMLVAEKRGLSVNTTAALAASASLYAQCAETPYSAIISSPSAGSVPRGSRRRPADRGRRRCRSRRPAQACRRGR